MGDPIELAALKAVEWSWDGPSASATPGAYQNIETALNILQEKIQEVRGETKMVTERTIQASVTPTQQQQAQVQQMQQMLERMIQDETILKQKLVEAKLKKSKSPYQRERIIQRFHFSSQLQRMSVLCKCTRQDDQINSSNGKNESADYFCLVKGSPEAIRSLLAPGTAPNWYDQTYDRLARRGLRVLALAYKRISESVLPSSLTGSSSGRSEGGEVSRGSMEGNLLFAGFIAFECKIRADSRVVVQALLQSDHRIAMITGILL